jgi:hypothetical protein
MSVRLHVSRWLRLVFASLFVEWWMTTALDDDPNSSSDTLWLLPGGLGTVPWLCLTYILKEKRGLPSAKVVMDRDSSSSSSSIHSNDNNNTNSSGNLSGLVTFPPMSDSEMWVQQLTSQRELLSAAGGLLEGWKNGPSTSSQETEPWMHHPTEARLEEIYRRLTSPNSSCQSSMVLHMQERCSSLELLTLARDLHENEFKLFASTFRSFEDAATRCEENVRIMEHHRRGGSFATGHVQDQYLRLHQMPLLAYRSALVKLETILGDLQEQIHAVELLSWKAATTQNATSPPTHVLSAAAAAAAAVVATQELRHAGSSWSETTFSEGGSGGNGGTPKRHSPPGTREQSRIAEYSPKRPPPSDRQVASVASDVRSLLMISDDDEATPTRKSDPAPAPDTTEWTTVATRARTKETPDKGGGLKLEPLGTSHTGSESGTGQASK